MNNNEVKELIESFKGYRNLLAPIQKNLADFADTYDAMRENIDKLNASFGGDLKSKVEEIFRQMTGQAGKTADLSGQIDKLSGAAAKYASDVGAFVALFSKIEQRLGAVLELESRAESQISRLDTILEEKTKNYNLKELQTALDKYNQDVKKVSEFINKDIADSMTASRDSLASMKESLDGVVKARTGEDATMERLLKSYSASEELLKQIIEKNDVNEAYIFELLDKWAESRKVKIKKG